MPDANHQAQKEYPMINILFLFPKSANPKELDEFISDTFIPRLKKDQGLLSLKMSDGQMMGRSAPPYSRIVEASFDSRESLMASIPADGDPAKEQLDNFGALVLSYDVNVLL
jgi:hypothetical protein